MNELINIDWWVKRLYKSISNLKKKREKMSRENKRSITLTKDVVLDYLDDIKYWVLSQTCYVGDLYGDCREFRKLGKAKKHIEKVINIFEDLYG